MGYMVSILPEDKWNEDYSTPCEFAFESISDMLPFIHTTLVHSRGMELHINEIEDTICQNTGE